MNSDNKEINLDILVREINMITKTFEYEDESAALENIRIINSNIRFPRDVPLAPLSLNEKFVKAFDGLSKFKDKIIIEIFNKVGQKLYEKVYNYPPHVITENYNFNDWPKGEYYLRIHDSKEWRAVKIFIIQ